MHVITEKGAGCEYAKEAPEKFHGVSSFNPHTGHSEHASSGINFSAAFGASMIELAEKDPEVVAITCRNAFGNRAFEILRTVSRSLLRCGNRGGTRFDFRRRTRCGRHASGCGALCNISSAADSIASSMTSAFRICPSSSAADRAGIVEDGPTHHGIYDESFLLSMPRLSVLAPKNETELKAMLFAAYEQKTPVAIRYPRGASKINDLPVPALEWGKAEVVRDGSDLAIWAVGREVRTALEAAGILGCSCRIVNTRFLKPFDKELFLSDAAKMPIFTIEDNLEGAGLDSIADKLLINAGHHGVHHFAWRRTRSSRMELNPACGKNSA